MLAMFFMANFLYKYLRLTVTIILNVIGQGYDNVLDPCPDATLSDELLLLSGPCEKRST